MTTFDVFPLRNKATLALRGPARLIVWCYNHNFTMTASCLSAAFAVPFTKLDITDSDTECLMLIYSPRHRIISLIALYVILPHWNLPTFRGTSIFSSKYLLLHSFLNILFNILLNVNLWTITSHIKKHKRTLATLRFCSDNVYAFLESAERLISVFCSRVRRRHDDATLIRVRSFEL